MTLDELIALRAKATPGKWRSTWDDPPHPTFGENTAVESDTDGEVVGLFWYDGLNTACKSAQDLLWEYAQRRRVVDAEFAADLETALRSAGYCPP